MKIKNLSYRDLLIKRKGNEFVKDLDLMLSNPFWNPVNFAKKYDLSRERVRQIFEKLYGEKYKDIKKLKKKDLLEDLSCRYDPRNKVKTYKKGSNHAQLAEAQSVFFKKSQEKNFDISYFHPRNKIHFMVNGLSVLVKSSKDASKTSPHCIGEYYHANLSKNNGCDFIAWYILPEKTFYIIPTNIFPSKTLYIRANKRIAPNCRKNPYRPYKEAWHLLI